MFSGSIPELQYQLALTMVPSVGPVRARELIREFGSARQVFSQSAKTLQKVICIGPGTAASITRQVWVKNAAGEMDFLRRHRISVLQLDTPGYPVRLGRCPDAPLLLFTRGTGGLHCRRSLSVVGTRRATSYGKDQCRRIIGELAACLKDLVIVSGLAYGIDVIAHRAALDAGIPTVAVLGHGFSTIYPSAHREVARSIIRQGALVTDFHSGTGPERNNFLRRNRIIAGLSDGTLVIESARSGGALITAGLASSYHRDVLAVPGRITDERSGGCNRMIKRNMAALVEHAGDVLYHMNWSPDSPLRSPNGGEAPRISSEEDQLLGLMLQEPGMVPEDLSRRSGMPVHRVLALLVEMELKNLVLVEPGNRYHARIVP